MSDVVVSVVESNTAVTVTEQDVAVDVTENNVVVSVSTAGIQGASYNKGDPIYEYVRNSTGATLLKGQIVYLSGATGNHVNVSLALASSDSTSARTIGWVSDNIANNAEGYVMMFGYLEGIDTSAASAVGDILYLSPTVAGGWTSTKPSAPQHLVYVGVCVRKNPSNGAVSVHIQNGYELGELHDVAINSPVNNQVLTYDSATDLWVNATNPADGVTSITAVSPLTGGTITSTGSIGLDQTALSIAQSQVSGLVSDLAGKANLAGGNALTGAQTITGTATGSRVLTLTGASGQTGRLLELQNNSGDALTWIGSAGQIRTSVSIRSISMDSVIGQLAMQSGNALTPTAILRGATSQTANLQEWQNDAGTIQARVTSGGSLVTTQGFAVLGGASISGSIASLLQSASASRIPVAVQGAASQSVDLQQWQNSAGAVLARIKFDGTPTFSYGTFFGTQTLTADGDSVVPLAVRPFSATQTADLTQWRNSSNSTIASITVLGGLNNPTAGNISLFQRLGGAPFLGSLSVGTNSASQVGLAVRGVASQTADLLELQNSSAVDLLSVNASGGLVVGSTHLPGAAAVVGQIRTSTETGSNYIDTTVNSSPATGPGLTARRARGTLASPSQVQAGDLLFGIFAQGWNDAGAFGGNSAAIRLLANQNFTTTALGSSIVFETASDGTTGRLERMRVTGSGTLSVGTTSSLGQLGVQTASASTLGLVVRGSSAQTADLLLLQNNGGTTQLRVDPNGMTIANSLGVAGSPSGISYAYFTTPVASAVPVVVRGAASQTANLQTWQDSSSNVLARVNASGIILGASLRTNTQYAQIKEENAGAALSLTKMTSQAGNDGAGIGRLYFRDGTNAGTLKLVVRAGAAGAETTILDNIPQ